MASSLTRAARQVANPVLTAFHLKDRRARHVFAQEAPSAQAAVDIFAGQWITAFPPEFGVTAGAVNHFDPAVDPRVAWAVAQLPNGVTGMSVLELGPFEAYQTALLEQAGAGSIIAVEGSETAYLKCLIVKELLDLHAHFLHGDVLRFLETDTRRFDIVWASGILYHQADPVTMLERIAERTDRIFLHTHFFEPGHPLPPTVAERMNPKGDQRIAWHGRELDLHCHEYADATITNRFAGGPRQFARWMERDDLAFVLTELGFTRITYGVVDLDNPGGPAMFLLASR